jgi:hypothetical protein
MAGQLTIGGQSAGMLSGSKEIGPITMQGNAIVGQVSDVQLVVGDSTIPVPAGKTAVCIAFTPAFEPGEVKIRTNLNASDAGLPILATGFTVFPIPAAVTSLILHATAVANVELSFI